MACLGIVTQVNGTLRRCRNYACLEEEEQNGNDGSIQTVRGFFCAKHKKHKSTGRAALRSRLCIGALGSHLELCPWQAAWAEELISTGYVEIRRIDLEKMEGQNQHIRTNRAYLLLLFARHVPGFHRSWAPMLWKESIARFWRLRQAYGPITITDADIRTMICVKEDMEAWIDGLSAYPEFGTMDTHQIGYTARDFYRFFDGGVGSKHCQWKEEWILQPADEIEAARQKAIKTAKSAVIRSLFDSEEYKTWRVFEKREWYAAKKARIEPIKEDIVAMGWHPDRFLNWCLDVEEKKDIMSLWKLEEAPA